MLILQLYKDLLAQVQVKEVNKSYFWCNVVIQIRQAR